MEITPVPCLKDNFAYLLRPDGERRALVVDPSEAAPVLAAAAELGLEIAGILNTHHHWDHVGGNEELKKKYGQIDVYGHVSDAERIPAFTQGVEEGDSFSLLGLDFRIFHIPGHTLGAVAYIVGDAVFTGDTLFAAGCGRLFEGTPAQMYESLNDKLGSLPDPTRVYFGHEYTASNLRFAAHMEPGNAAVKEKAARVAAQRERGEHTTPSTIGDERATNPFMRCDSAEIVSRMQSALGADKSPQAILGAVRAAKDNFK
jgi:hydroxyacylglutathione hydrolase